MRKNRFRCLVFFFVVEILFPAAAYSQKAAPPRVVVGAERLDFWLPLVGDKQVGLVVNQTSLVGNTHLLDTLLARGVCVVRAFSPEHGMRGSAEAGEQVIDGADARTGVPIASLYGRVKKPRPDMLEGLDLVIFDIQDVGTRFYTYISTLYYVLEACAQNDIPVLVLDRPNPNGHYVDGPVLDMRLASFVGIAPLPIVHGCTVGELARLFKGEYWIYAADRLKLTVVPCLHYTHRTPYDLPVRPSPNLPDMRSILLYPSTCLFEGTSASVGRGTDAPFQLVGHPDMADRRFSFVPKSNAGSRYPPHQDKRCYGYDLRTISLDSLRRQDRINLQWLLDMYCEMPNKEQFFLGNRYFDLLTGTTYIREMIAEGCTADEIRQRWLWDLKFFRDIRSRYLLYPD